MEINLLLNSQIRIAMLETLYSFGGRASYSTLLDSINLPKTTKDTRDFGKLFLLQLMYLEDRGLIKEVQTPCLSNEKSYQIRADGIDYLEKRT